MNNEQINYKKNLTKIIWETILTSIGAGFSVATITVFWNSIGMDQTAIGFVQMAFTIVVVCLDIPMGYIADRFNKKALNIIGDIGVALGFLYYAFSQNMYMALIAECLLGVFLAMTNGVDQSFIKYNCVKIDETGELFKKVNARVHTLRFTMLLVTAVIGGFIAKYSLRATIGMSFVPYFLGGIIAFGIQDYGEKKEVKDKNPFKDLIDTITEIIKDKKARISLICYMIGKELTHAQIWVFTPLLMLVGVPIEIVSMGWILNYFMQIVGSKISEKMIHLRDSNKFIIPVIIEILWMLIIIFNCNIITVWLFALNGFVCGLLAVNLTTTLQESTRNEIQTSVMSIASTGARLLYVPLVYFINYLGNINLQLALVGVCGIFAPLCLICFIGLKKMEKN